ncbi:NXPE family member 1-like isoform X1 [Erinaceus europaeus]|uniref:NXPE family member 1-like isoform X1 n=1 Tax=Erinaceus europaeus TaxID=9365 RepID=A0ABM3WHG3_ERIEU|nr:NXPE family member 1-like isoform X1 [Erinaceus europaeus]
MSCSVMTQKGLMVLVVLSFLMVSWIFLATSSESTKTWPTVNLLFSSPKLAALVRPSVPTAPGSPVRSPTETELRIKGLVERLDRLFPPRPFSHLNATTSAAQSRATILNPRGTHCRGEQLHVLLEARDHLGRRKEYGGDFLRARLASPGLKAGVAGRVTDLQNGSYLVSFSLPWQGRAWLSVRLVHPSEGASALWRARNRGYDKITFQGQFVNGSRHVFTECGLRLNSTAELCEYLEARDQEAFYCVKPPHFPCDAFVSMFSQNGNASYLTSQEQLLFARSNVGEEMLTHLSSVQVSICDKARQTRAQRCRTGMQVPVPGGYALQGRWTPTFCSRTEFDAARATACLKGKLVHLLGDSTLRQWVDYFPKLVKTLKLLGFHGNGVFQHHLLMDVENDIQIHWKRHTYPFVTVRLYSVIDVAYIPREIDRIPGDRDTAVAITLGQHFRAFPVEVFARRVLAIRRAVERLLLRSPGTKVILKTENVREMHLDAERFSDFHGHVHLLILKDVFRDLDVGLIDAWDMTIAFDGNSVHPTDAVIAGQVDLFLNYIC